MTWSGCSDLCEVNFEIEKRCIGNEWVKLKNPANIRLLHSLNWRLGTMFFTTKSFLSLNMKRFFISGSKKRFSENKLWPPVILKSVKQIQANIIVHQIHDGFHCILFVLQFCFTIATTRFPFRQNLHNWVFILYIIYENLWLYVGINKRIIYL